jgi:hypothetical protein
MSKSMSWLDGDIPHKEAWDTDPGGESLAVVEFAGQVLSTEPCLL